MLGAVHQQYLGHRHHQHHRAWRDDLHGYRRVSRAARAPAACACVRRHRSHPAAERFRRKSRRFITGLPFRFGEGDEWLKAGPLKIVADGGILIGTSFMRQPYGLGAQQLYAVDDAHYRGFLTLTPEQIAAAFAIGHRLGWQMVAHVTGDAGVDVVLDAIEAAQKTPPASDRRHTLIHAYFVQPGDRGARGAARSAGRYPASLVLQGRRCARRRRSAASGWPISSACARGAQAGVEVAINTDHMFGLDRNDAMNPFNPFLTMYAATTRRTESGQVVSADRSGVRARRRCG